MVKTLLEVITEFDPNKYSGIKIRPQFAKCLSVLKKGQKINPKQFVADHLNEFTHGAKPFKTNREVVYHSFWIGKKIGMLKTLPQEKSGLPISFDDFCKLETISYFMEQLRGPRYKNTKPEKNVGTKYSYAYRLWSFNNWLHGKTFEFNK